MNIKRNADGKLEIMTGIFERALYAVKTGMNGHKYVDRASVTDNVFHVVTDGNSKTGAGVINVNFPIEYTCDHRCECYKLARCYASGGCYSYSSNQAGYSENFNFWLKSSVTEMSNVFQLAIDATGARLFRYFTCGDIPDGFFLRAMVKTAQRNPSVKFWAYTKRYGLVNSYIDRGGIIPDNLVIIFSHWMNDNGTYFPMDNHTGRATSEFIPLGKEHLAQTVTHICPCSDPSVIATCATCDHPCYDLKPGESMALMEHSTSRTRTRDKAIKASKEALKAVAGAVKKAARAVARA